MRRVFDWSPPRRTWSGCKGETGVLARLRERAEAFPVVLEFENPAAVEEMVANAVRLAATAGERAGRLCDGRAGDFALAGERGCGVDIGFLPRDAPVFQFVEWDFDAGHRATDKSARRDDLKVAVEVAEPRFTSWPGSVRCGSCRNLSRAVATRAIRAFQFRHGFFLRRSRTWPTGSFWFFFFPS